MLAASENYLRYRNKNKIKIMLFLFLATIVLYKEKVSGRNSNRHISTA
jgi:hypothetical protein